jgi:predicted phage baseplate assembly protein
LAQGVSGTPPPIQLYTLANAPVAWLPQPALDSSGQPLPETLLLQQDDSATPRPWSWFRQLLDAGQFDLGYMLEPARYATLGRNSDGTIQSDYDSDGGDTIRFGDGVFGINPDRGIRFTVTYRYGAGAAGNVAADSITRLDPTAIASGRYLSVTNPRAAVGGADPQSLQSLQRLAPQAFRAQQFRAVIADDYSAAAETLPWVLRAGAVFRWTGSWLTVFTTPDPLGSRQITIDERTQLIGLLNRRRMAGYESYVPDPDYVSLDLRVDVCARPDAFQGDVEAGVVGALSPGGPPGGLPGFFAPDNFTFGQPLERGVLEAAIQAVPGVAGVTCIYFRVRGRSTGFTEMTGDTVQAGTNQIIRCDNDPSVPEHGAFAVMVAGGR